MSEFVEFDGVAWRPDHVSMVRVGSHTHTSHEEGCQVQRMYWVVEVSLIGGQIVRIGERSKWSQQSAEGIANELVQKLTAEEEKPA